MSTQKSVSEVSKLRLMFQMNSRLRLESLAALSKVFRDFGVSVSDELLASVIFAVPDELLGYSNGSNGQSLSEQVLATKSREAAPPPPTPTPPPIPPTPAPVPPTGGKKNASKK